MAHFFPAKIRTNQNKSILSSGLKATPFSIGAGEINPNSALNPGLVYPISNSGYRTFLCSDYAFGSFYCFNFENITRAIDLNLPSVSFYSVSTNTVSRTRRTLELVGPPGRYIASVKSPPGSILSVSPSKFDFSTNARFHTYKILIKPTNKSENVAGSTFTGPSDFYTVQDRLYWTFGSITWYDNKGHVVRINVVLNAT